MKVTYRLPTDQYAYIELTEEVNPDVDMGAIKRVWEDLKASFSENPGVPRDVFNKFLDNQLMGTGNDVEDMIGLNERQMLVVQEVKKAIKRAAAKK